MPRTGTVSASHFFPVITDEDAVPALQELAILADAVRRQETGSPTVPILGLSPKWTRNGEASGRYT